MTCLPLLLYLPKQRPKILLADWKSRYIAKFKHGDHQPKNPKTTPYLTDKSFVSHIVTSAIFSFISKIPICDK